MKINDNLELALELLENKNTMGESNKEIISLLKSLKEEPGGLDYSFEEDDEEDKLPCEEKIIITALGKIEIRNISSNMKLSELIESFESRIKQII
jgi:hypothetical protein